jgi:probable rRNA maturation factor
MNTVEFFNETKEPIEELGKLKKLIKYALKHEGLDNVEFDIIFVDNNRIKELNRDYRNIDRPTDVITFALEDYQKIIYDKIRVLGDIYISTEKAKEQSIEYGHSYLRELSFLMIHGLLHLLGYDHMNEEDEKIMFRKQEEILNEYGINR